MTRICTILVLVVVCYLAMVSAARSTRDGEYMTMSKTHRTNSGVVRMRGYVGLSRRGGMAFAGGYAGARTEDSPSFATPSEEDTDPEDEADDDADSQEQEDPAPEPAPAKPDRPSRARPSKPSSRPSSSEEFGPPPPFGSKGGRGGATAISTSYSNGKGATANSHAIAYDGQFTGGQYKHK